MCAASHATVGWIGRSACKYRIVIVHVVRAFEDLGVGCGFVPFMLMSERLGRCHTIRCRRIELNGIVWCRRRHHPSLALKRNQG